MKTKKYLILSASLMASTTMANIKIGYGHVENIYILPSKIRLDAKLDTGAGISSISATNIHIHDKNGEKYVSFDVTYEAIEKEGRRNKDKIEKVAYDLPLVRLMNIKNRAGEDKEDQYDERPVIEIPICFDGKIYTIEANLTDRTHFDYPVLLGRQTLIQLGAVIDPAQKFTINGNVCVALFEKMAKVEKNELHVQKNEKSKIESHVSGVRSQAMADENISGAE